MQNMGFLVSIILGFDWVGMLFINIVLGQGYRCHYTKT